MRGEASDGVLHDHVLYTPTQAGRLIGVSYHSVVRMIDAGLIRRANWGGRDRRIIGAEIKRYVASQIAPQETGPAAGPDGATASPGQADSGSRPPLGASQADA